MNHMMRVLCLVVLVTLCIPALLAAQTDGGELELKQPVKGDFTLEWWHFAEKLDGVQTIITSPVQVSIRTSPAEAKKKSPRQQFVVGDGSFSNSFAYGNRWYHIAVVHDSDEGTSQLFINGFADGKPVPLASSPGELKRVSTNASFPGQVKNVAVHPRQLSQEQILERFKGGMSEFARGAKPVTVAHRGNHRYAPENTLVSYREAMATGAPIMEIDLRLSADGVAVLMHDETVDRTTNAKGPVGQFTASELARLDAGSWKDLRYAGEPVPTLEQVAELCRGRAIMMLDLKPTGLGPAIAEVLNRMNYPSDQVMLAPWDDHDGAALRALMPEIPLIRLGEAPASFDDAYFERMKQIGFSGFSFSWRTLSLPFIDRAHEHGMKVYTWTLNDSADVSGAVLAGVDGIITDDPRATMQMIDQLCE